MDIYPKCIWGRCLQLQMKLKSKKSDCVDFLCCISMLEQPAKLPLAMTRALLQFVVPCHLVWSMPRRSRAPQKTSQFSDRSHARALARRSSSSLPSCEVIESEPGIQFAELVMSISTAWRRCSTRTVAFPMPMLLGALLHLEGFGLHRIRQIGTSHPDCSPCGLRGFARRGFQHRRRGTVRPCELRGCGRWPVMMRSLQFT